MGMSASQARLIALTARMNDIEYQGQQINQQRTTLSNQINELYNTLLNMEVPTPPSVSDFSTIQYSGKDGTVTYNFDTSNVKPQENGLYNITLGYTAYGSTLSKNNGYKYVRYSSETIGVTEVTTRDTKEVTTTYQGYKDTTAPEEGVPSTFMIPQASKPASGEYYIVDDKNNYVLGGNEQNYTGTYYVLSSDAEQYNENCKAVESFSETSTETVDNGARQFTSAEIENLYKEVNGELVRLSKDDYTTKTDGVYEIKEGLNVFKRDDNSSVTKPIHNETGYTIEGKTAYNLDENEDLKNKYAEAIENFGLKDSDGNKYGFDDFMYYTDDEGTIHFAIKSEVRRATVEKETSCNTYNYNSTGAITKNQEHKDAKITFDPSSGRITSIDIPSYDKEGNIVSYTTIEVSSKSVTDDVAYDEAMNDYEYDKLMYDRKQQEINAKTSVIQQQDKSLELKLTRLDNERNAVNTEIEAVKKVVQDNIDKSYKTFSG